MKETNEIKVMYIPGGTEPTIVEIENSMESFSELVNGNEPIMPFISNELTGLGIQIVAGTDADKQGLCPSVVVYDEVTDTGVVIWGDMFFVGVNDSNEYVSLNVEQAVFLADRILYGEFEFIHKKTNEKRKVVTFKCSIDIE